MCVVKRDRLNLHLLFIAEYVFLMLQNKYGLDVIDYITYFQIMYNKTFTVKDRSFNNLLAIHNHFQYKLLVTDKPLAELLDIIQCLKATALNWK